MEKENYSHEKDYLENIELLEQVLETLISLPPSGQDEEILKAIRDTNEVKCWLRNNM